MVHQNGSEPSALIDMLTDRPYAFDFFWAVRVLECALDGKPKVGYSTKAADDPVRFAHEPTMSFAPSTLKSFGLIEESPPKYRLLSYFLGLVGPDGPLPVHITDLATKEREYEEKLEGVRRELILERNAAPDSNRLAQIDAEFRRLAREREKASLPAFLDIFHHRMISLFYRAWATCQPTVSYEHGAARRLRRSAAQLPPHPSIPASPRPPVPASSPASDAASLDDPAAPLHAGQGEMDRFAFYVGSLIGVGLPAFRERDAVPDVAKLHYAGRLVAPARNAEGLAAILADFFGVPVDLQQFLGHWMSVPPSCRCSLGQSPDSGILGSTLIVGDQVWDCQQRFRLRIGPMCFADYSRMLPESPDFPGGQSLRRLVAWVRNYIGEQLDWDAQLVLAAIDVHGDADGSGRFRADGTHEDPQGFVKLGGTTFLGYTGWLGTAPFSADADDLIVTRERAEQRFSAAENSGFASEHIATGDSRGKD